MRKGARNSIPGPIQYGKRNHQMGWPAYQDDVGFSAVANAGE
jgi:hypothetical protein